MFAKLYDTDNGQILVVIDRGACEVTFTFEIEQGVVADYTLGFNDDDEGYTAANKLFDLVDKDKAQGVVNELINEAISRSE